MKRIVRLVFNSIPIIVSDIFVRGIGINRIDPPEPQIGATSPAVSAAAGSKRADVANARP